MNKLLEMARSIGTDVVRAALPLGYTGYYVHDEHRIYLNLGLTPPERRTTLAHELGHAIFGHDRSTPANEHMADSFAAGLLINQDLFDELVLVSPDEYVIARKLQVTVDLIFFFEQHCLGRGNPVAPLGFNDRFLDVVA